MIMNKNTKKLFKICSLFFLVVAIIFFVLSFFYYDLFASEDETVYEEFIITTTQITTQTSTQQEFVSPIDFEALQEVNSDVVAWIQIDGIDINYPILCSQTDNTAYLSTDMYGEYDVSGEIFIENYNQIDFSDPVTIIYGHNMLSGDKFGNLKRYYSNYENFYENNTIYVYLPNETKQYQIFAAVPYDTTHILYYNDFLDEGVFDSFISEITDTRSLIAVIDDSVTVTSDDKLIILSTCYNSGTARYLVLAIETTN